MCKEQFANWYCYFGGWDFLSDGGSRATAHLGETTLLDQVVENVRGSQVDEIVMILGHQAETIKERIAIQSLRVVINES